MPVLPLVASMIVLSFVSSPRRSPSRIIDSAGRSFTEPPGLYHSALAYTRTSGGRSAVTRLNASSGVLPIRSTIAVPTLEARGAGSDGWADGSLEDEDSRRVTLNAVRVKTLRRRMLQGTAGF